MHGTMHKNVCTTLLIRSRQYDTICNALFFIQICVRNILRVELKFGWGGCQFFVDQFSIFWIVGIWYKRSLWKICGVHRYPFFLGSALILMFVACTPSLFFCWLQILQTSCRQHFIHRMPRDLIQPFINCAIWTLFLWHSFHFLKTINAPWDFHTHTWTTAPSLQQLYYYYIQIWFETKTESPDII